MSKQKNKTFKYDNILFCFLKFDKTNKKPKKRKKRNFDKTLVVAHEEFISDMRELSERSRANRSQK